MLHIETEQSGDLGLALLPHVVSVPLTQGDHPVPVVSALEAVGRCHHPGGRHQCAPALVIVALCHGECQCVTNYLKYSNSKESSSKDLNLSRQDRSWERIQRQKYYLAITENCLTIIARSLPDPERDLPRPLPVLRERDVHLPHLLHIVIRREEITEETANFVKNLSSLPTEW